MSYEKNHSHHSSLDSNGNKINLEALSSYSWQKEEWFKRTLKGQWSTTSSGMEGTVVTDILRDQAWQKAFIGAPMHQIFATRIEDESTKSRRVLVNIASMKWITQGITSALNKKKNLSSAHYLVLLASEARSFLNLSLHAGKVSQPEWFAPESFWQAQSGHLSSPDGFFRTQVRELEDENWPLELKWNIAVGIAASYFYAISGISALIVIISLIFLMRYTRKHIVELLNQIADSILGVSRSVSQMSQAVRDNVGNLVDSVNQEKSLIQEASAATDELFAMAGNNQTEAEGLAKDNTTVLEQMAQAERSAQEMRDRIKSLQEQLHFFQTKLEESNTKLNNTQGQMETIRKKIQVINEIVFQTKILSFNASVEAAKAGEHGKGFAVVAEEIGNLARMSGESASQITQIVQESTSEINQTIQESRQTSEDFLSNMNQWANEASQALEVLQQEFSTLQGLLMENEKRTRTIAQASSEQRLGIEQIVEANQRNNEIVDRIYKQTQDLEILSRDMNQESTKLQKTSRQLEQVIQ